MTASETTATADAAIAVAAHLEAELEEALAEAGLTRASFTVLRALDDAPERTLGQRELLGRLRRTAGTLSVRLARLEKAGLITRTADPDDRRATRVQLTDAGRERLARARPLYEQRAGRLAEALPEPARRGLGEHLRSWLEFFEPGEDDAPRLGIAVAPSATANRMRRAVGLPDHPGVLVMRVAPDSPAAAAGLARGDLLTVADGREVRTAADLQRAVRRARGRVALALLRGAEPLALDVQLT
jgi:DNA-binding MarR family transcriptional regulator